MSYTPFYLWPAEWAYEAYEDYVDGESDQSYQPKQPGLIDRTRDEILETQEKIAAKLAEEGRNAAIFGPSALVLTVSAVAVALNPRLLNDFKKLF